ncbi:hypothetical protein HYX12_00615, partial [Candidatus Woesearchaeota archaeon]|nr:hypothetical protein [Candidatus Woesearchaeota archaeon]
TVISRSRALGILVGSKFFPVESKLVKFRHNKKQLFEAMTFLELFTQQSSFSSRSHPLKDIVSEVVDDWTRNKDNIATYCNSILVLLTNSNESELFQALMTDKSFSDNKERIGQTLTALNKRMTCLESTLGDFVSNLRTIYSFRD